MCFWDNAHQALTHFCCSYHPVLWTVRKCSTLLWLHLTDVRLLIQWKARLFLTFKVLQTLRHKLDPLSACNYGIYKKNDWTTYRPLAAQSAPTKKTGSNSLNVPKPLFGLALPHPVLGTFQAKTTKKVKLTIAQHVGIVFNGVTAQQESVCFKFLFTWAVLGEVYI